MNEINKFLIIVIYLNGLTKNISFSTIEERDRVLGEMQKELKCKEI